jgi:hypothetical protein
MGYPFSAFVAGTIKRRARGSLQILPLDNKWSEDHARDWKIAHFSFMTAQMPAEGAASQKAVGSTGTGQRVKRTCAE